MSDPAKILIVDDHEPMRFAVSRLMQSAGYEVFDAASGAEGLAVIRAKRPDLVLLDVLLPDLNGVEVLRRIKADPEISSTFVVHLSAQTAAPDQKLAGLEHGADGYISQPVENRELLLRVHAFLRHKKSLDQLRESEGRYRKLFEANAQPMWIVDDSQHRFLAVNDAASRHYGYSAAEFLEMSPHDLENRIGARSTHRKKDGEVIEVELTTTDLSWNDAPAKAVLISDITARRHAEEEKTRKLEQYQRELLALERIASFRRETISEGQGRSTLREALPSVVENLTARYRSIVERALEQRIFKVTHDVSGELRELAEQLAKLQAAPRDVVELHHFTLKALVPQADSPRSQAFAEVGRLTIIELMGCVAASYRRAYLNGSKS